MRWKFLSKYPLNCHEESKNYTEFIDLSTTTKTNFIKIVYMNNISSFIPFNESILQNLETKSGNFPKIEQKTVRNNQKGDSINTIHPLKSNLKKFSRKLKTLLRYWKKLKLNDKGILV